MRPAQRGAEAAEEHTGTENTASVARLAIIQEGSEVLRNGVLRKLASIQEGSDVLRKSFETEPLRNLFASKLPRFSRSRTESANVSPAPSKAQVNDKEPWNAKAPWRLRALDAQPSPHFPADSRRELRMRATDSLAPFMEGADDVFPVRRASSLCRLANPKPVGAIDSLAPPRSSMEEDVFPVRRASSFPKGGFAIISPPKDASATDTLPALDAVHGVAVSYERGTPVVASARHRRPAPLTTRQPSWPPMQVVGQPALKDSKDPAPSPPIRHVMAAMRAHGRTHLRKWLHEKKSRAASIELAVDF